MSINHEMVASAHAVAVDLKRHIHETHDGADLPPHVWGRFRDKGWVDLRMEEVVSVIDRVLPLAVDPVLALETCLTAAVRGGYQVAAADEGDELEAVIFHTEGFFATAESEEQLPPEGLEHEYNTNPATDVRSALVTSWFEANTVGQVDVAVIIQPYGIEDGGLLVFGEPIDLSGDEQRGRAVDVVTPWLTTNKEVR